MPYPYLHFRGASNGLEQLIGDLVRGPRPGTVFLPASMVTGAPGWPASVLEVAAKDFVAITSLPGAARRCVAPVGENAARSVP